MSVEMNCPPNAWASARTSPAPEGRGLRLEPEDEGSRGRRRAWGGRRARWGSGSVASECVGSRGFGRAALGVGVAEGGVESVRRSRGVVDVGVGVAVPRRVVGVGVGGVGGRRGRGRLRRSRWASGSGVAVGVGVASQSRGRRWVAVGGTGVGVSGRGPWAVAVGVSSVSRRRRGSRRCLRRGGAVGRRSPGAHSGKDDEGVEFGSGRRRAPTSRRAPPTDRPVTGIETDPPPYTPLTPGRRRSPARCESRKPVPGGEHSGEIDADGALGVPVEDGDVGASGLVGWAG